MGERVRMTWSDLVLGGKTPWNIYDEDGKLLISSGHEITKNILDKMTKYVLYRDENQGEYGGLKIKTQINAFEKFAELVDRLGGVFEDIVMGNDECKDKIEHITRDIIAMINNEVDASLACVFLPNKLPYSLSHPIQCAIICGIIAGRDCLPEQDQEMLVGAALTSNIGMTTIQNQLHEEGVVLTEQQKTIIKSHPEKAVEMLKKIGVNNKIFLDIVLRHHERCDGSGYPFGVSGSEIPSGALILAIADSFCAMLTDRSYCRPLSIKEAMIELFKDKGTLYDGRYELLLIKEVTVFPPGSFVKLKNGEIAIVIRRGKTSSMQPTLKSIMGRDGQRYANPLIRDCTNDEHEIEGLIRHAPKIALNTSKLWEYV